MHRKTHFQYPEQVMVLAGTPSPAAESREPFAAEAVDFLDAFSEKVREAGRRLGDPEMMALAFWCRRAHVRMLRDRHRGLSLEKRLGRGRIFHLAPANVPMMFFYTYAVGLLAGNAGIVRVSDRTLQLASAQAVLQVLRELFEEEKGSAKNSGASPFASVRARSSFIRYDRSDAVTEEILRHCDGRVLWGGDETIRQMRRIPMPAHAVELCFPDRVSLAVIDEETLEEMGEEALRNLVHRFYNDTYVMDQNGCSSPQTVIWLKKRTKNGSAAHEDTGESVCKDAQENIPETWWELLAQEAEESYEMDGFRAARKLEKAALAAMQPASSAVAAIRHYHGNLLHVLRLAQFPEDLAAYRGGFGLFYETEAEEPSEIFGSFSSRIQTVVCIGIAPEMLAGCAMDLHAPGALRFVEPGQALQMDTVWDGTDLVAALSREIFYTR